MTTGRTIKVAVVAVTWNSAAVLPGLLRSVRDSHFEGEIVVVVVDNDSSDDTAAVAAQVLPEARVIPTGRNAGYAAGANRGVAAVPDADYYLLVNPDLRLDPAAIQALVDEQRASGAGIVVPRLTDESGVLRWSMRRDPSVLRAWGEALLGGTRAGRVALLGEMECREWMYRSPCSTDWATGAAMLISRECSRAVGAWDESFFLYSEETDFALRARDAGFSVRYTPDALAVHFEGDSHQSPSLYALLAVNRVRLFRKRHGPISTAAFRFGALVAELIRSAHPVHRAALLGLLGRRGVAAQPGT
ncbi:glycosyltransferase [Diaminobutyricimonas sp. LJ205]|uniref:glycosyltransferase n=1 Tax=Diaminobutyricimonas sp. LJ205 TaxID=2683590 RepID=UPI0012F4BA30|nr:glycosyltransferase family 2 protein [Diaminobutyricimonas sp. LJ205]